MPSPQHIPLPAAPQTPLTRADAALGDPAAHPPIRSLYIHTPFCSHKCHYCDFYSFVDHRDRQGPFVDRLLSELEHLAPHAGGAPLKTIFIGGGTPSLLRVELWERLLARLGDLFDLSLIRSGGQADSFGLSEFTVECNPESTTPELMGVLRAGGVNRVSVGAQSFNPRHLATLERRHRPENVARAIEAARAAGISRQSADFIFAIPGQTLEEWAEDLRGALALGCSHLSCYNLTYEPNTAMTRRLEQGAFAPVDEDLEAGMYELTVRTLAGAGLERYEVSNFAARGSESRHNVAYWIQDQWLAAGPSASGHVLAGQSARAGSHRWKNAPRLGAYLESGRGFSPIVDHERPDPLRLVRERIMMGLRLRDGLDAGSLMGDLEATDPAGAERLRRAVAAAAGRGLLVVDDASARWRLTNEGFLLADGIAAELMGAVQDDGPST